MRRYKQLALFVIVALAIPFVHAAVLDTISESMGLIWNFIGALFSFEFVSNSPGIQRGIMRFFVFIMLTRIIMYALSSIGRGGQGMFDNKTAGIIGVSVAAITVLFTPNDIFVMAIIAMLIPLLFIGYLIYVAVEMGRGKDGQESRAGHAFGALLAFIAVLTAQFAINLFQGAEGFDNPLVNNYIDVIFGILLAMAGLVFFYKLFKAVVGDASALGRPARAINDMISNRQPSTPRALRGPTAPHNIRFGLDPQSGENAVRVAWDPNPQDQNVVQYEIQWRQPADGRKWQKPKAVPHAEIVLTVNPPPTREIQITARAIDNRNRKSAWSSTNGVPGGTPPDHPGPPAEHTPGAEPAEEPDKPLEEQPAEGHAPADVQGAFQFIKEWAEKHLVPAHPNDSLKWHTKEMAQSVADLRASYDSIVQHLQQARQDVQGLDTLLKKTGVIIVMMDEGWRGGKANELNGLVTTSKHSLAKNLQDILGVVARGV